MYKRQSDDLSRSFSEDKKHIATDEDDTAREAVLEGQAMAVFVDYSLAPAHRSLRTCLLYTSISAFMRLAS